jgi:hypothetical protein
MLLAARERQLRRGLPCSLLLQIARGMVSQEVGDHGDEYGCCEWRLATAPVDRHLDLLILVRHMSAIAACTGLCSAARPTPSRPSTPDTIARTAYETLILCKCQLARVWKLELLERIKL